MYCDYLILKLWGVQLFLDTVFNVKCNNFTSVSIKHFFIYWRSVDLGSPLALKRSCHNYKNRRFI